MTCGRSAIISNADALLLSRAEDAHHLARARADKMVQRAETRRDEETNNQKSVARLWAHAAHDLRQPVQAALLVARMLEVESARTAQKQAARHVAVALESLSEILEVLALLSRIEAGLQGVPLRIFQLSDVLEPTMREFARIAKERSIPLRLRSMRGVVRSNPKLVAIATRSLLLNAIKFGNGDRILVCCRKRGSQLRLEVQFGGAALDGGERNAFVQLSPLAGRSVVSELGLGFSLLEHLCNRLGHLHYTKLPLTRQLLALELPLAPAAL
jgi:two-component system, sensor histidine kinase